jgi:HK97 gp10 family phage protein
VSSVKWEIDPIKQANKLKKGTRNKALRIAVNRSASPVKAAVAGNAPRRHGYLSKSIRIRVRNYKGNDVWLAVIGPSSKFRKAKGKRKRGPNKGQPIYHNPSKYAHLVERGTKRSKASPFLKPALQSHQNTYRQSLTENIRREVDAMLAKGN